MTTTWIPDRKIWASGLAYVAAALLVKLVETHAGIDVPPFLEDWAPIGLAGAVGYFLPPSVQDVLKRLNDQLVAVAALDPKIPVSPDLATIAETAATAAKVAGRKL